ncbi:MAG: hypothetical protein KJN63_00450, partial [Acidimicrobiia bacterium]|nr:hypothetical protein [Acidimicrobiia bacterium]
MSLFAAAAAETFQPESVWFGRVWLVPALPALSFLIILLFGKRFKTQVHWVGLAAVGLGLIISTITAFTWITQYEDEQAGHGSESGFVEEGILATVDAADDDGESAEGAGQGCLNESNSREPEDLYAVGTEYAVGATFAPQEMAVEAGAGEEKSEHIKAREVVRCLDWFTTGSFGGETASGSDTLNFSIGTIADGQSIMMLFVVTAISFFVHMFSVEYVKGDRRYVHYYAFLSLFTASMLFMVLSASTLQLIVGWELVGVCSFALIGHWWEDKPNSDAALKAFLTNRVGDIGLLVGMIVLFFGAGQTFDIMTINYEAVHGGMSQTTMTVASLCLLAAVMSKSGQFILHTWLPDAMAGPTPVSALIHAATMVVAGIYMVGRLYPVFWEG